MTPNLRDLTMTFGLIHIAYRAWRLGAVYEATTHYVRHPRAGFEFSAQRRRDLRGPKAPECAA